MYFILNKVLYSLKISTIIEKEERKGEKFVKF